LPAVTHGYSSPVTHLPIDTFGVYTRYVYVVLDYGYDCPLPLICYVYVVTVGIYIDPIYVAPICYGLHTYRLPTPHVAGYGLHTHMLPTRCWIALHTFPGWTLRSATHGCVYSSHPIADLLPHVWFTPVPLVVYTHVCWLHIATTITQLLLLLIVVVSYIYLIYNLLHLFPHPPHHTHAFYLLHTGPLYPFGSCLCATPQVYTPHWPSNHSGRTPVNLAGPLVPRITFGSAWFPHTQHPVWTWISSLTAQLDCPRILVLVGWILPCTHTIFPVDLLPGLLGLAPRPRPLLVSPS